MGIYFDLEIHLLRCVTQGRTAEKDPGLVSVLDGPERQTEACLERLRHARIEGPGATLAYMADDKLYVIILSEMRHLGMF